jgi:CHAD domain-containing protein
MLLRLRFAECLERQGALGGDDDEALHAFRLTCKRLRYAIERYPEDFPELQPAAECLAQMTDELGAAHDCVVLAELANKHGAQSIAWRARQDRNAAVKRAIKTWRQAFRQDSPFAPLATFTGFTWSLE